MMKAIGRDRAVPCERAVLPGRRCRRPAAAGTPGRGPGRRARGSRRALASQTPTSWPRSPHRESAARLSCSSSLDRIRRLRRDEHQHREPVAAVLAELDLAAVGGSEREGRRCAADSEVVAHVWNLLTMPRARARACHAGVYQSPADGRRRRVCLSQAFLSRPPACAQEECLGWERSDSDRGSHEAHPSSVAALALLGVAGSSSRRMRRLRDGESVASVGSTAITKAQFEELMTEAKAHLRPRASPSRPLARRRTRPTRRRSSRTSPCA